MVCSFGGGTTALILNYCWYGHTIHVGKMVTAVMGSLVSYGSITFLCSPIETMIIGLGSALLVFFGLEFLDRNNNLDDPCCTFLVHGVCGVWGLLATGIFARKDVISEGRELPAFCIEFRRKYYGGKKMNYRNFKRFYWFTGYNTIESGH